jgi:peroxiredoxin Q/BCP
MLKVGEPLPDFEAETTAGSPVRTGSLLGQPAVVFFFPRAFTPGCVRETKAFRDAYPSLARRGVRILGVSTDCLDAQCRFAEWAGVPFPLVADTSHALTDLFGVCWPLLGVAKRVTFVADAGGIVRNVFRHELRIEKHVVDVQRALEALAPASAPA